MAFQVTSAAAREILEAAVRSDAEGMALRVAAKSTPQGLQVGMGFDDEATGDAVVVVEGLSVLVAPESQPWLDDMQLDFVEVEGGGRDFVFTEAKSTCGSGGCSRCGGTQGGDAP